MTSENYDMPKLKEMFQRDKIRLPGFQKNESLFIYLFKNNDREISRCKKL